MEERVISQKQMNCFSLFIQQQVQNFRQTLDAQLQQEVRRLQKQQQIYIDHKASQILSTYRETQKEQKSKMRKRNKLLKNQIQSLKGQINENKKRLQQKLQEIKKPYQQTIYKQKKRLQEDYRKRIQDVQQNNKLRLQKEVQDKRKLMIQYTKRFKSSYRQQKDTSKISCKKVGRRPLEQNRQKGEQIALQMGYQPKAILTSSSHVSDIIQPKATEQQILSLKVDSHFEVKNRFQYPYSAIGSVIRDSKQFCTGCIIGAKFILTCAHICIDLKTRSQPGTLTFTPGPQQGSLQGKYRVKQVYFDEKFIQCDTSAKEDRKNDYFYLYDFAVLELDTQDNLEELYGSIGYDFNWLLQREMPIFVTNTFLIGYVLIKQTHILTQYSGDFLIDDKIIRHRMPTQEGTSGSPILQVVGGEYYIRGIHSAKTKIGVEHRTAVLLDQNMLNRMEKRLSPKIISYDFDDKSRCIKRQGLMYFIKYIEAMSQNFQILKLSKINLAWNDLTDDGCDLFKAVAWLNLKTIDLTFNQITDAGCKFLKETNLPMLQELYLCSNKITAEGCKYLIQGNWKNLMTLNLYLNNIKADGCRVLAQGNLSNLKSLDLTNNKIKNQGCSLLIGGDWTNLQSLNLTFNSITAQGCEYLKQANWKNLRHLNLNKNIIKADGCKFLKEAKWLHLQILQLKNNQISEDKTKQDGCKFLKQAEWTHMQEIDLNSNGINSDSCKFLMDAKWPNIHIMNLGQNNIQDKGCKFLSNSNWPQLKHLIIKDNNISDVGCKFLKEGKWPKIQTLIIRGNAISQVGKSHLLDKKWDIQW